MQHQLVSVEFIPIIADIFLLVVADAEVGVGILDDASSITLDFGVDSVQCEMEPLRHSNVAGMIDSLNELQQSIALDEPVRNSPLSSLAQRTAQGTGWDQDGGKTGSFGPIPPVFGRNSIGLAGMGPPHTPHLRHRMGGGASTQYGPTGTPYHKRMFQPPAPEWGPTPSNAVQPPGMGEELEMQPDSAPLHMLAAVLMSNVSINILVQHVRLEVRLLGIDSEDLKLVLDIGQPAAAVTSPLDKEVGS